jgi:hypothetical protein
VFQSRLVLIIKWIEGFYFNALQEQYLPFCDRVRIALTRTITKVHNVQPTIFELLKYRISKKTIEESVEKETRSEVVPEENK